MLKAGFSQNQQVNFNKVRLPKIKPPKYAQCTMEYSKKETVGKLSKKVVSDPIDKLLKKG